MIKLQGAEDYPFYFGAKAETLRLAGDLRRTMTKSEKLLWQRLRNRQVDGLRFRRQHPVNEFIVDFFCYEAMLAIEIDGTVHIDSSQHERDTERTRIMNRHGIKFIRFTNEDVDNRINSVLDQIRMEIKC